MTTYRDLSNLPDDQSYWDDLEARIVSDARARLEATREPVRWWAPLAARALPLGGVAAAAAIAALLLLPDPPASQPMSAAGLLGLSDDPVLEAFLTAPAPPPLAELMLPLPESRND